MHTRERVVFFVFRLGFNKIHCMELQGARPCSPFPARPIAPHSCGVTTIRGVGRRLSDEHVSALAAHGRTRESPGNLSLHSP